MNITVAEQCLWRFAVFLEKSPKTASTHFDSLTVQALDRPLSMLFLRNINSSLDLKPILDMICVTKWNLQKPVKNDR